MLKHFVLLIFVIAIFSQSSNAITVGKMSSRSKYGEPLRCEIELFNLKPEDIKDVKVNIVNKNTHGIMSTVENILGPVDTSFMASGGIGWVVLAFGNGLDSGPVDLVVEFEWPGGRVVRHYKFPLLGRPINKNYKDVCTEGGAWQDCVEKNKNN